MEDIVGVIVAPIVIFLIFVAPLWLFFHYRAKGKMSQSLSEEEYHQIRQLADIARKLDERVQTLESILDAESKDWRSRS